MYVIKRDGRQEKVHFDKITARIRKLSYGLNDTFCDPTVVAQKVCMGVYKGVTTSQLDELAAETAAAMTASHPDYALVGSLSMCHFNAWSSISLTFPFIVYSVECTAGAHQLAFLVPTYRERLTPHILYSLPMTAGGSHRCFQSSQEHQEDIF